MRGFETSSLVFGSRCKQVETDVVFVDLETAEEPKCTESWIPLSRHVVGVLLIPGPDVGDLVGNTHILLVALV